MLTATTLSPILPGGRPPGWRRHLPAFVTHRLDNLQWTFHHSIIFKMWIVFWLMAVLVLVHNHVSTSWMGFESAAGETRLVAFAEAARAPVPEQAGRAPAVEDATAAPAEDKGRSSTAAPSPSSVTLDAIEEAVRLSVERLARNDAMAARLGARLLREVASHLQLPRPTGLPAEEASQCARVAVELPGRAAPLAGLPPLYVVTPTYRRPEQVAELTRLSHTLLLVRNVRWLVIEDAKTPSKNVAELLRRTGLRHEHLTAAMPDQYKKRRGAKPKGVAQRNRGLQWLRANASEGVFYFADDDNTYDVDLFEEIRSTRRVSMFPVGLCTKTGLSTPIVSSKGAFMGFYDGWVGGRKFPVDMAGFAVSVKFLLQRPKAQMPFAPGFEEDGFLRSLAPFEPQEAELKADNCTKVLVWHTQSKPNAPSPPIDMAKHSHTNLAVLKTIIV